MAFVVRWFHVVGAGFILGGAVLVLAFLILRLKRPPTADSSATVDLLMVYEFGFWIAIAVLVATGVGNLAHFGKGLQGPGSTWGHKLEVKLALVSVFVLFSIYRTASLSVQMTRPNPDVSTLAGLYGATSVFIVGIIGVAIALAHF